MASVRSKPRQFEIGDVIRTHPFDDFWGCAVVLSTVDFDTARVPLCMIGITPFVYRHAFAFAELSAVSWSLLQFERYVRIAPDSYVPARVETCAGIYERRVRPGTVVIGSVDPSLVMDVPAQVRVGNGADGGWPLCGKLGPRFGSEAIVAWRKQNDREKWESELAEARRSTELVIKRVAERARTARQAQNARKAT